MAERLGRDLREVIGERLPFSTSQTVVKESNFEEKDHRFKHDFDRLESAIHYNRYLLEKIWSRTKKF